MARYIDADKLIKSLAHYKQGKWGEYETLSVFELESAIENFADTNKADVAEIKRGRWIETRIWGGRNYKCSVCDYDFTVDLCLGKPMWHYCPNCGAKMQDEE